MAKAPYIIVVLEDSTGRTSPVLVNTETTNGVDEFRGLARAVSQSLDNLSDCRVVSAGAFIPFEPNFFDTLGLKTTALESDVENKGWFQFLSEDGFYKEVSVPGIKASLVDNATNLIPVTGAVNTFVTAMTSNFVDNALNITPTDERGSRLLRVTAAAQKFRASRKRRSALKLATS